MRAHAADHSKTGAIGRHRFWAGNWGFAEIMNTYTNKIRRILAIDACPRGFGFAVIENSDRLIDWGVKELRGDKNPKSRTAIEKLIACYEPDLVVVEDCTARGSRRRRRI